MKERPQVSGKRRRSPALRVVVPRAGHGGELVVRNRFLWSRLG